jgi:hypothetical protein
MEDKVVCDVLVVVVCVHAVEISGSTILLIRHCTNGVTVTQCVDERVHHMWVAEERERQGLVFRHKRRYTHGLGLQMSILYTPQTVALPHFLSILDLEQPDS